MSNWDEPRRYKLHQDGDFYHPPLLSFPPPPTPSRGHTNPTMRCTTHPRCRFCPPHIFATKWTRQRGVLPTLTVVSIPRAFPRPHEPDGRVYHPPLLFTSPTPSRNHTNPTARCTTHPRCLFSPSCLPVAARTRRWGVTPTRCCFRSLHLPTTAWTRQQGLPPTLTIVSAPYAYLQLQEPDGEVYHPTLTIIFPPWLHKPNSEVYPPPSLLFLLPKHIYVTNEPDSKVLPPTLAVISAPYTFPQSVQRPSIHVFIFSEFARFCPLCLSVICPKAKYPCLYILRICTFLPLMPFHNLSKGQVSMSLYSQNLHHQVDICITSMWWWGVPPLPFQFIVFVSFLFRSMLWCLHYRSGPVSWVVSRMWKFHYKLGVMWHLGVLLASLEQVSLELRKIYTRQSYMSNSVK